MDPIKIGKFINERRKEKNMSQSELANILNVTSQAVSKWENGRGIPDIEMLKKLSEVFEVNVDELLNGEENKFKKKNNKKNILYFGIIILIVLLVGIALFLIKPKNESFQFSNLASDNDAFTIKGVMAYTKNKKSVYISEVNNTNEDEEEYKSIECILYESDGKVEKLISKVGELNSSIKELFTLTELLKGIEFNVDNYDCGCKDVSCSNLYLRINALNGNNKVITYQIPIQLESTCEE